MFQHPRFLPRILFSLLLLLLTLTGCEQKPQLQFLEGFAQGTTWHITYWSAEPVDSAALLHAVQDRLAQIDAGLSGYRPDSTIEAFNSRLDTDPQDVGAEIVALVEQARIIQQASQGCYDITIKPAFDLWGFRNDVFTPPTDDALRTAMEQVGMDKLMRVNNVQLRKTVPGLQVDLASIGQGYSVGQMAAALESFGVKDYLVEIGGELQTRGHKPDRAPWRVAVEKPVTGQRKVEKVITIGNGSPLAVITSGTYRHFFDQDGVRYSHILDGRTGRPIQHDTVAVTVVNADPSAAGAWATALLCLGAETGQAIAAQQGIAAIFFTQGNTTEQNTDNRSENGPLQEQATPAWRELAGVTVE